MPESEPWSWSKFFHGFFDGNRFWKNHALIVQFIIIIGVWYFVVCGVIWTKDKLFHHTSPQPQVINSGGAPVDTSQKHWILNLFHFGGQNN